MNGYNRYLIGFLFFAVFCVLMMARHVMLERLSSVSYTHLIGVHKNRSENLHRMFASIWNSDGLPNDVYFDWKRDGIDSGSRHEKICSSNSVDLCHAVAYPLRPYYCSLSG